MAVRGSLQEVSKTDHNCSFPTPPIPIVLPHRMCVQQYHRHAHQEKKYTGHLQRGDLRLKLTSLEPRMESLVSKKGK